MNKAVQHNNLTTDFPAMFKPTQVTLLAQSYQFFNCGDQVIKLIEIS